MKRRIVVHALTALALVACGIDVVGVAPVDGAAVPDASVVDGRAGPSRSQDQDSAPEASAPNAPPEAGPGVDANPCSACPAGTPRKVCASTGCLDGNRVFVTSTKFTGSLDGLAGADAKCQDLAAALGGTWRAWLSTASANAADRMADPSGPFRLVDGTVVATSLEDLTDESIASDIHLDEKGGKVDGSVGGEAWTGSDGSGTYSGWSCQSFASDDEDDRGTAGVIDKAKKNGDWSDAYEKSCNSNLRLYCFEQ